MKIILSLITFIILSFFSNKICYAQDYVFINTQYENMHVGEELQILINIDKNAVKWSSSDNNIATVSDNGIITANAPGIATITAMFYDYKADCVINVSMPDKKHVLVSHSNVTLPFVDNIIIYSNDYDMKDIYLSFDIVGQNIVVAELGEIRDNKVLLRFEQIGIGCAIVFINAELDNGDIEELEVRIFSTNVNFYPYKHQIYGAAAYLIGSRS